MALNVPWTFLYTLAFKLFKSVDLLSYLLTKVFLKTAMNNNNRLDGPALSVLIDSKTMQNN
jgi:hypothetical protein